MEVNQKFCRSSRIDSELWNQIQDKSYTRSAFGRLVISRTIRGRSSTSNPQKNDFLTTVRDQTSYLVMTAERSSDGSLLRRPSGAQKLFFPECLRLRNVRILCDIKSWSEMFTKFVISLLTMKYKKNLYLPVAEPVSEFHSSLAEVLPDAEFTSTSLRSDDEGAADTAVTRSWRTWALSQSPISLACVT